MAAFDPTLRRKLFWTLLGMFVIGAPLLLLYSQGYVLNFENHKLVKTGGVFVRTVQSGASIFVDSELYDKTSFISRGALITDLFPKRYTVRVEKDGYQPWQKVVRVSDEEVIEFRNVFLPSATITPTVLFNTKQTVPTKLHKLTGRDTLLLEVGEEGKPSTLFLIDPKTRTPVLNTVRVGTWVWDQAARGLFIGRGSLGRLSWYRLPIGGTETEIRFRGLPAGFSAARVSPHPIDPDQFYFFAGGAIFLQGNSSVPIPIAEEVETYEVTSAHLYFLTKNGFFVESSLSGSDTHILGRKGMYVDEEHPPRIIASPRGEIVVIDSAGGLFLYQPEHDQELQLIGGNIRDVDFSKNGDRMLYWDENRFWVYWLTDNSEQPFELARSRKQIFATDSPIRSAYLDAKGAHVYFATDAGVRMTEVDDRSGVNSYTLVDHPVDSLLFEPENLIPYWSEGPVIYSASIK